MKLTRRVVTGHDANGRSVVISDGAVPAVGADLGQLIAWAADTVPAPPAQPEDIDGGEALHEPPHTGVKVFYVEIPPDPGTLSHAEKEAIAREMFGQLGTGFVQPDRLRPARHHTPPLHARHADDRLRHHPVRRSFAAGRRGRSAAVTPLRYRRSARHQSRLGQHRHRARFVRCDNASRKDPVNGVDCIGLIHPSPHEGVLKPCGRTIYSAAALVASGRGHTRGKT